MSKVKISDEYVQFSVEGLPQAEKKTTSTLSRITKAIAGTAALAKVGLGAVGVAAGLMWKGFQGTREGDQFANAMTYLARVVANEAAPALRIVTVAIVSFADAIRTMSPEAKTAVAVVAALGATLMVVGTGPIGLIVTGILAATVAIVAMSDSVDELTNRLKMMVLQATGLTTILPILHALKPEWGQAIMNATVAINKKAGDPLKGIAERLFAIKTAVKDLWSGAAAAGPLRLKVAAELESPANTWERIQKAFAESRNELNPKLDEHLGGIKGKIDGVIDAVKNAAGGGIGK